MSKVVVWLKNVTQQLDIIRKQNDELIWAEVFNSTIRDSSWFTGSISPGRWAVGYPFLYVLYRVLNEVAPKGVLELGLGQSSKMTCCYASRNDGVEHIIIDHDQEWIDFFYKNLESEFDNSTIIRCDLNIEKKDTYDHYSYHDFNNKIPECKFDLLLIDAPFGSEHDSRNDVLEIIPNRLAENFCIIIDDYHRGGEQETVEKLVKKLRDNGIAFCEGTYSGVKATHVIVSTNWKFLCSL